MSEAEVIRAKKVQGGPTKTKNKTPIIVEAFGAAGPSKKTDTMPKEPPKKKAKTSKRRTRLRQSIIQIVSRYSNFACRKKERYHGLFSGGLQGYLYVNRVNILMRIQKLSFLFFSREHFSIMANT